MAIVKPKPGLVRKLAGGFRKWLSLDQWDTAIEYWGLPDEAGITGTYDESVEAFQRNAIFYSCVCVSASAAKGVPLRVFGRVPGGDDELVEDGDLVELLERPNPGMSWASFVEWLASYLCLDGNNFIRRDKDTGLLYPLRPDKVEPIVDENLGIVTKYKYKVRTPALEYEPEEICHIRTFDPLAGVRGQSYAEAAMRSIRAHNLATIHGIRLLENDGRPSGALIYKMRLTKEQRAQVNKEVSHKLRGAQSAGKTLILEGGEAVYVPFGGTPKDLDWGEGKKLAVFEICGACGVDPMLIGFPEFSSLNNRSEAKKSLYTETALPLLGFILEELTAFLCTSDLYGDQYYLGYREADVKALREDRGEKWNRTLAALQAGGITINEFRSQNGLDPVEDDVADQLWMPSTIQPILGGDYSQPQEDE